MGLVLVEQKLHYFGHPVHFPAKLVDLAQVLDLRLVGLHDFLLLHIDVVLRADAEQVGAVELLFSLRELTRRLSTLTVGNLVAITSCNFLISSSLLLVFTFTPSSILRRPSKLIL